MITKNISLDVDYVKNQFPAFNDPLSSKWTFFENAGGSYVPHNVIKRLNDFMSRSKIIVIASHSKELLTSHCNRFLIMQNGNITELKKEEFLIN